MYRIYNMKIDFQKTLQKLSKYEYKSLNDKNKQIYSQKVINYRNHFLQLGGVLIHEQIDPNNQQQLVPAIENVFRHVSEQDLVDNKLGGGQYGTVYLLLDNVTIKVTTKKDSQRIENFRAENTAELNNNIIVNDIAQTNLCFPKYYYQNIREFTIGGNTTERGIFVSERLYPIFELFDNNEFKADLGQNNIEAFYKQMFFLLFSLKDYFDRTRNVLVHNDFKLDNILLRKMNTPENTYLYTLANGSNINIPLINYNGNKWLLVLNDFGESYSYNNAARSENVKEDLKIIVGFKFLQDEGFNINPQMMQNYFRYGFNNYLALEYSAPAMMGREIDINIIGSFFRSNVYERLRQNITNM